MERVYYLKAARTRALNAKHAGTSKHSSAKKHTPSATRKSATAHKQTARRTAAQVKAAHLRALSEGVACCAAEAAAASLRLTGRPVSAGDVLALYRHTADAPSAGASIVATLEAALAHGVAGVSPVSFGPVAIWDVSEREDVLILGLELPEGPHAVTTDPGGGVWSWGGLYDLTPEAVVEEAWAVVWPC